MLQHTQQPPRGRTVGRVSHFSPGTKEPADQTEKPFFSSGESLGPGKRARNGWWPIIGKPEKAK